MIIELPNVIDEVKIAKYRQSFKEIALKKKTLNGSYNREGLTINVFNHPELDYINVELRNVISDLLNNVVRQRFKPFCHNTRDTGFEYHRYDSGQICHVHGDGEITKQEEKWYLRYLTFILFLTTNKDGDLVFPAQDKTIKPEAGKVVFFPPYGFYSHYTKPDNNVREILMTWLLYSDWELKEAKYD